MINIDVRSREPIYSQLEKQIVKLINLGIYEKDSMLPSVRSMACELGINPNTVAKAYKNLEQAGAVYTVAGKGVFVSSNELDEIHKIAIDTVEKMLIDVKNAGVDKAAAENIIDKVWGDNYD